MKKLNYIWGIPLIILLLSGCKDHSTDSSSNVEEPSSEKQFVWNAMNYWYYWQADVQELGDNYFDSQQSFYEYLNGFSDAEAVFDTLIYEQDGFSFFIDDYEEFQNSQQGISKSFGYEFGLIRMSENGDDIFGYVQYVVPNSPAQDSGLVRGDLFTKINGTQLTVNNYRDLLLNQTSYQLSLAEMQNGSVTETGETVDLQAVTLTEDPVYLSEVLDEGNTKVGYLMYNAFQRNSHQELNDIFGNFLSAGIDELVVDLRYNGGGAGITSQTLGSMISGLGESSDFATYRYNSKRSSNNVTVSFLDQVPIYENGEQQSEVAMNKLSIDRVFFLVGSGTASASEMLINSLKPNMDVILIGQQTVGKDEGSYTLYDAPPPYLKKEEANPNHKKAIQPIVIKLVNSNGQDYPDGFVPEYEIIEYRSQYLEDLPLLGDKNDPLLSKALDVISGQPSAKTTGAESVSGKMLIDSRDLEPYGKRLYLQPPGQH